ncbi:hypothetical protein C3747_10g444 [Trypanosoma cruzi]|uniref:Uncharacterized protein n=1 Tax=Trypanosoma cruzi TaxID=5693 RepID=A0A2V2XG32_TRYCR|nr:hypothetical protein TcYC6_0013160 [Trypanosoma cruzi]PWV19400.1 hypothetical protein C3747_10g444 [Trypanosoma cruzi]RNC55486.1 hypothetical protein TcCL_ESM07006 [Trypanosoma cruzi]
MQRSIDRPLGRGGNEARDKRPRKHISFARDGVKVCFVKPPPRSMNHCYWFTETELVAKKGLFFEVEPDIDLSVDVMCRMQLTSVASQPWKSPRLFSKGGGAGEKRPKGRSSERVFLEIKASPSLGSIGVSRRASRWLTVASVEEGQLEKVRVILPAGSYALRCVGPRPVQVFAQVWDVETRLD